MNDKSKSKPFRGHRASCIIGSKPSSESYKHIAPGNFNGVRTDVNITNTFAPPDPLPKKGDKDGGRKR